MTVGARGGLALPHPLSNPGGSSLQGFPLQKSLCKVAPMAGVDKQPVFCMKTRRRLGFGILLQSSAFSPGLPRRAKQVLGGSCMVGGRVLVPNASLRDLALQGVQATTQPRRDMVLLFVSPSRVLARAWHVWAFQLLSPCYCASLV